jgi:integrase
MALDAYFTDRERRGSKGVLKDRAAARSRISPAIGDVELPKLTTKRIRDWHTDLATAPKLVRSGRIVKKVRKAHPVDTKDVDAVRARRATANRTLAVLKAALNHAFHDGRITTDEAWRKVKPFRAADAPVIHFLSEDECRRIVDATKGQFRDLVRGALVTGCRYGELIRMRVADFNASAGKVTVRLSKSGKPRHVVLADEGRALFEQVTAGRALQDLIFRRDDDGPWGPSHQQRPLAEASGIARLDPPATFHILRHTYASSLAMKGVPMGVIAAQLGYSDTRMTEKHYYAHLSPNYVAETVRGAPTQMLRGSRRCYEGHNVRRGDSPLNGYPVIEACGPEDAILPLDNYRVIEVTGVEGGDTTVDEWGARFDRSSLHYARL